MATKNTKMHKEKAEFLFVSFCVFCGQTIRAEEASLSNLQDIVMPDPVSAWPPAPGAWVLLMLITLIGGYFFLRWLKAYRKNAYRRTALVELVQAGSVVAMAEILRRVALQAYGRETVVSLQGEDWFQWLEVEGGFPMPEPARLAVTAIYAGSDSDASALKQFAREWIINHAGMSSTVSRRAACDTVNVPQAARLLPRKKESC